MWLNATSLALIVFCVIVIVLGIVKIHEYPGVVAASRNHPQHDAIVACSVMGLLFFPLWVFALLWAYGGVIGTPLPAPDASAAAAATSTPTGSDDAEADASSAEV